MKGSIYMCITEAFRFKQNLAIFGAESATRDSKSVANTTWSYGGDGVGLPTLG